MGSFTFAGRRCLIFPRYEKSLGTVLRDDSIIPLPRRHVREMARQIIQGMAGKSIRH
jgi:hypothetical protein